MSKLLTAISIFFFSLGIIHAQHEEIVYSIPTDQIVHFDKGYFYWIDWEQFEVNGLNYGYGDYIDIAGDKTIYPDKDPGVILLEGQGGTHALQSPYGIFEGESGYYRIIFNVDITHPSINTKADITIVSKEIHLSRNKYNKLAKGVLTRKLGDIFIDENGCEWELQLDIANLHHDPVNNVKLLHKVVSGGEYETIRILLPDEKGMFVGAEFLATQLKGDNLIIGEHQSSYNFGHTPKNIYFLGTKHYSLDMAPDKDENWGGDYDPTKPTAFLEGCRLTPNPSDPTSPPPTQTTASTLFLFDLSGSMNQRGNSGQPKLQEAKLAAENTLNSITADAEAGIASEVCVMGFRGSCSSPISVDTDFQSDLSLIKTKVGSLSANGGTPLVEAIEVAECKLVAQLNKKGQNSGKLIILSDGQAGCQKVRPEETYIYGQTGKLTKNILPNQTCGNDIVAMRQANEGVKYYTIGFNIKPGSSAERDLQYLAQASGGKYLNVQSRDQLEKALKKFNRTYIPKPTPALSNLPSNATGQFKQGVTEIMAESFFTALATCEGFVQAYPKDCHGVYNLALMQEASDLFLDAAQSYETYLTLCPTANDKDYVEKQIKRLEEEQRQFILFQKQVITSDLEYLKAYYQSLFNQKNEVLAKEFKGFIKEKGNFYANLPKVLNMENEQWLIEASKDLSRGLKRTTKTVDKPDFDRMAVSLLTFPIETLEGIVKELK